MSVRPHGSLDYLQLPALDLAASAAFYAEVFGWSTSSEHGSFEAPGLFGQFIADRQPSPDGGPLLWLHSHDLFATLTTVPELGGTVVRRPWLDGGERWLAEIDDPAGNRIGIVVSVTAPRPQTMIAVRDVEASSRWYQRVLGFASGHGGPDYERLLADGEIVLQLHQADTGHHHGLIGDPDAPVGNGVLIWFGEVSDFDDVVARATELGAPVLRAPHRNPPEGEGNGPGHREFWFADPDGYTVVVASPDGEAFELR
jgi:predicted enzyme related to lactoylglutathione lyase